MKFSRFMIAGSVGAVFAPITTVAFGADLPASYPPPPAPKLTDTDFSKRWAGLYVGVNAGLIGHTPNFRSEFSNTSLPNDSWTGPNGTHEAYGALVGGQIGYNFQHDKLVLGLEGDLDYSTADKTTYDGGDPYAYSRIEALGTARLRLGHAIHDHAMIYVTGGLAFGKLANQINEDFTSYMWSGEEGWKLGFAVGGGGEVALNDKWSVKGEALYYDLGSHDHVSITNAVDGAVGASVKSTGFVIRLGLNYKFH